MRAAFKKIINNALGLLGLKLVRTSGERLSGVYLFEDLKTIINKETPVCLDVGANEGQTVSALCEVFSNPLIHAFEPSTEIFQTLRSKKSTGRVFLHNVALGIKQQKRQFNNYEKSCFSSFLPFDPGADDGFRLIGLHGNEMVEVDTVDRFLQQNDIHDVDLLKIDTQGFDLEVLSGAVNALQKGIVRNVLVELTFVKMYEGQSTPEDIIQLLKQHDIVLVDYYEKVWMNNRLAWCTALFGHA